MIRYVEVLGFTWLFYFVEFLKTLQDSIVLSLLKRDLAIAIDPIPGGNCVFWPLK